jgi:Outer membrane protein beta-barrel domain
MLRTLVVGIFILLAVPVWSDSITFLGSYFSPDGRSDIYGFNHKHTTFDTDDLNDWAGTVKYDHFFGDHFSIGGSASYYKEDAVGLYRAFRNPDGTPLVRDFRLRMIPAEFNATAWPVGRHTAVVLFVGGGVGLYLWEYTEVGDRVINIDTVPIILHDVNVSSDGRKFGFNVHGGIEIPFSDTVALTIELRRLFVEDDLDRGDFDRRFDPIDLSMTIYSGGFSFSW